MKKYVIFLGLCLVAFIVGAQSPVAIIPFQMENGSIIVEAKINDSPRPLRLLFDTGADGMAIKQDLADSVGLTIHRSQSASVVGGTMRIDVSSGNTLHFGSFAFHRQSVAVFKEMGKGVDGLLGNTFIHHYVTEVDFDKLEIRLYHFGRHFSPKNAQTVPFSIPNGLILMEGSLHTGTTVATGRFVFDTGAAYSLICFRPFVRQHRLLVSGFKMAYQSATVSMGISSPTFHGNATTFTLRGLDPIKEFPVSLMAGGGQNEQWNPGFDGSIGIRLISRFNFTIDVSRKEISVLPNRSYSFPFDFRIGQHLLGFNQHGKLQVLSHFSTFTEGEEQLARGTIIEEIHGTRSEELLQDPTRIEALKKGLPSAPVKVQVKTGDHRQNMNIRL